MQVFALTGIQSNQ